VAERDPFGRLPDENPLAGLGSLSDERDSQGAAQPVVAAWSGAEPADTVSEGAAKAADRKPRVQSHAELIAAAREAMARLQQAPPEQSAQAARDAAKQMVQATTSTFVNPATVRRFARFVILGAVIATVVFVIVIAAAVLGLSSDGGDSGTPVQERSSEPADVRPSPLAQVPAEAVPENAPVPVGLGSRSLLVRRNLAPALKRLRTSGLGRLRTLRIAPERIDVQLLTRGGRLRSVQLRYDGELRKFGSSGPGFGSLPTLSFAQIDAAAPARLARGAAGRMKKPVSQVDYVVRIDTTPQTAWSVVMRSGGQFVGDGRGHITRRIG
jgi:hypothetical protein